MNKTYVPGEIARRGQALYEEHIRSQLGADDKGKFLCINVETGDYELDWDEMVACQRARQKHPDSAFFIHRVGYRAAHRLAGHRLTPQS